ncbi:hypothetical protein Bca52824_022890 [Brassica carinata]|uniref:Ubiquitin-like protease family profile domain-containing protein n=1 Tax=Brassica carinata TaxID=52824 RepID=A0A8X8ATW8_BRACI|nr:hypothetical protein Bca52824_022890 [Brassica carinata]
MFVIYHNRWQKLCVIELGPNSKTLERCVHLCSSLQALVESIMLDGNGETSLAPEYQWSDDEDDVLVSNMLNLIDEGFGFTSSCFLGGATKQDVCRMREVSKAELVNRKTVKSKNGTSSQVQDGLDIDLLASIVREKLKDDFQLLHGSIATIQEAANGFTETILVNVNDVFGIVQDCVGQLATISQDLHKLGTAAPVSHVKTENAGLDPAMLFPNPTFSLGLTQEGRLDPANNVNATVDSDHEVSDEPDVEDSREEVGARFRISKRQKVPTKLLMGEYECDKGFLNRARKAVADAIYKGGNIDYPAKFAVLLEKLKTPFEITTERGNIQSTDLYEVAQRATQLPTKVVDVLVFHTTTLFRSQSYSSQQPSPAVFMDTQFVSQFTKLYTKFSKSSKKDTYKFNGDVVDLFLRLPSNADAVRFYFPFYLDKKYWVAICVDCSSWSVTILDCNISLRTDFMMNKELRPFAMMFPYFLKQVGRKVGMRECKAMAIERPRSIPQQKEVTNSAVSSLLFIQAHAVGGLDACKCITPDVLGSYVERLLVSLYEASVGPL